MPGLPRQIVGLPLAHGVDASTSRYLRLPQKLESASNIRSTETGSLATRFGFTRINRTIVGTATNIDDEGPVRALGASSEELLAVGHRSLYAYVPDLAGWVRRGHVSPCVGRVYEVFRDFASYHASSGLGSSGADAAIASNGIVVYASHRLIQNISTGTATRAIEFHGSSNESESAFKPLLVDATSGSNQPFPPSVATTSDGAVSIHGYGDFTVACDLKRREYKLAVPGGQPTTVANITADLYTTSGNRTYDVLGLADGTYIVGFISFASRDVELRRYAADHTLLASGAITGTFAVGVALAREASDTDFYLLTVDDQDTSNIVAFRRNIDGTLSNVWGPTTIGTFTKATPTQVCGQLGLVEGVAVSTRVNYTWCINDFSDAAGIKDPRLHTRDSDNTGGSLATLRTSYNSVSTSRPFVYRNRFYLHAQTNFGSNTNDPPQDGFLSHALIDVGVESSTEEQHMVAALHSTGQAPAVAGLTGVSNHIYAPTSTEFRHMLGVIGEAGPFGGGRVACDEYRYTFDAPVSVTEAYRGCAVVSGGYLAWYDGTRTFELGFASPPFIRNILIGAGATPPAGTYQWSTEWEDIDTRGVLHRSVPSPPTQKTLAGSQGADQIFISSLPWSRRSNPSAQVYRAGADLIPRRLETALEMLPNSIVTGTLGTVTDSLAATSLGLPIYTAGGVFEAAPPEGARIARLVRERMVIGDFFRLDRVQFSKILAPSSIGETQVAPEFIEPLGRIVDRGERITGIGSLDSATVVFTDRSIYLVGGYGPDSTGAGDDFSRLTRVPCDDGCIEPRSVVEYPDGVLYQASKGLYLLGRDHAVSFIGDAAHQLTTLWPVITSAVLVPEEQEVRFTAVDSESSTTDGGMIVFDYRIGEWFQRTVRRAAGSPVLPVAGAAILDGVYSIMETTGQVWLEDRATHLDDVTRFVPTIIETGEIQPAGPQQHVRLGQLMILGERRDPCSVTLSIAYDYNRTATAKRTWSNADLLALTDPADRMQLQRREEHRCQSFRVRLETATDGTPVTGEGVVWHALNCEVGLYGKLGRVEEAARS